MFDVYCRHCEAQVLLSPRRVLSMHNTSEGIVVYFRCWRGHAGVLVTGRAAGERVDESMTKVAVGPAEPTPDEAEREPVAEPAGSGCAGAA